MESQKRRCIYATARQKKKLVELITKNPELISRKNKPGFTFKDAQQLWQTIANECNSLAGAKKTWKQWRKTWQDLKSKTNRRNCEVYRDVPTVTLTPAEQEVLGINYSPRKSESPQQHPEFVQLGQEMMQEHSYNNDIDFTGSMSELESPPENKVFTQEQRKRVKTITKFKNPKHSDCLYNCDALTSMERKKLQVKEDYLKFKKDYLRQKLKLIKEQTEALKSIARELSK